MGEIQAGLAIVGCAAICLLVGTLIQIFIAALDKLDWLKLEIECLTERVNALSIKRQKVK